MDYFEEVQIGKQIWMKKNLNVDTFRNGYPIPEAQTVEEWLEAGENKQPAWCYYENDPGNGEKHGKLYNWYALTDPRGLAPNGWDIPTKEDCDTLLYNVNQDFASIIAKDAMSNEDFNYLAQLHNDDYEDDDDDDDNDDDENINGSGFSAYLSGYRDYDAEFKCFNVSLGIWSSTPDNNDYLAFSITADNEDCDVDMGYYDKADGRSVRCIKRAEKRLEKSKPEKEEGSANPIKQEEIKIGSQIWMVKNLDVDTFRNGDPIPQVILLDDWKDACSQQKPAWCYYDNDSENGEKYGKLYNWYAVNDPRGLAPEGWRIPSKEDYEILINSVNNDGKSLISFKKKKGAAMGTSANSFSLLSAGGRYIDGSFDYLGKNCYLWSSTEDDCSFAAVLRLDDKNKVTVNYFKKDWGFSIRCVSDDKNLTNLGSAEAEKKKSKERKASDKTKLKKYKEVKIGKQTWMQKNLDVDTFLNGDPIPKVRSDEEWKKAAENKKPSCGYPDNKPENREKYGMLYNWYAVNDKRGLAPKGWDLPSLDDFDELVNQVKKDFTALIEVGQGDKDKVGTNSSGFSALLGGVWSFNSEDSSDETCFWSSTEISDDCSYALTLQCNLVDVDSTFKDLGFSVRCIKDSVQSLN